MANGHSDNLEPLWKPSTTRIQNSKLSVFLNHIASKHSISANYSELHRWSISHAELFWDEVWSFCGVIGARGTGRSFVPHPQMYEAVWFPEAKINFAENLLRFRDEQSAIIFWNESQNKVKLTYKELFSQATSLANQLKELGVTPGDRVVGFLPNIPEGIIAMLAATSIGAIWSSCSPDFGTAAVLDRFGQITPKVLFAAESYPYNGKTFSCTERVQSLINSIPSISHVISVRYPGTSKDLPREITTLHFEDLASRKITNFEFTKFPFNHPVYILYSSGTTGIPKCIVHGAGGTLLQHLKEHQLHTDLERKDKIFYHTTCGWMMWNWLVSALATGATVMLYDGAPFVPTPSHLFDFAEQEGISIFGTSARYLSSISKENLHPANTHNLSALKTILSTGSPLLEDNFQYVYEKIKADVCLSSISGGTDIVSCFALGNPLLPVYSGELQCAGLGMDVQVWNDAGQNVIGEIGELVCPTPFPSMPVYFWNDPKKEKFHNAYFSKFPNIWHHGDWVKKTEHEGFIFYGRSDSVLNPGGVRIGTAEIYRQLETVPEVLESVVTGYNYQDDEHIVLFVRLQKSILLDSALEARIKTHIRSSASPRHVPRFIFAVEDIPRTVSGKIAELAVKDVIHGRVVKNKGALANPESLAYFEVFKPVIKQQL